MPPYPTGSWMPVALSADLPAGTVMPAPSPAGPIALWRSRSGRVAAFADRCPHRGMRLSHGFVRGETLSCIYHGWSYAQVGNCLRIPAHPALTPPDTIRVATQPVEDGGGIIWIPVGEPAAGPPRFDGVTPLRSMVVEADIAALESAAGTKAGEGLLDYTHDGRNVRLLLAPEGKARTLMHVLVDEDSNPSERIAASRAAEALRRAAEHVAASGTAR
ncbi:Rieske (2Fe-2S) protein [Mesorhizobium sp. M2D.F.Ca.ET.185.01.1.1]|uniref:Rieske 2Fe-2S domain-containing protein n=1 Tax=unclassified Mesorhizobium TaxID=325217 RepID=UPI000FCC2119|nr:MULTISPECIES: Rieske 2Fe-2S domain-containing protein [unclassified Mesorhizobium]TGP82634.1 Rieske (2Fe-2S) protein [bacterium M00.F.Ca.ET.227.01.1.1]TGP94388.1 Rieske (2Fe-2S) protein [bacterium M00.F.Ca.ET.221.01.1.1]TGP97842.1 Rieske (2Fe-2S) protein [bacterium M00.F.Ca.ET.222.01.1.1]TGU11846.1 Rieske (2Fe-2S) protein [bacterium M00.F.Ca.ET.163.01.1.1]TGU35900.1 Rieske (2Fe-2S) protein [bacterium M00.F.Ca.ET.156.01.1.1]TGU48823.1 Rieske (2Fe-2S) protein [bacterium M00.F.Ca.ET.146.01.1.